MEGDPQYPRLHHQAGVPLHGFSTAILLPQMGCPCYADGTTGEQLVGRASALSKAVTWIVGSV